MVCFSAMQHLVVFEQKNTEEDVKRCCHLLLYPLLTCLHTVVVGY